MNTAPQWLENHAAAPLWLGQDALAGLRALRQELAAQGRAIFDVSMLNPDIPPPRQLLDKLMEGSLNPENHKYAVSRGVRKLREAFGHKYERRFAARLDAESQICVTAGTKDALLNALTVLRASARELLIGAPSYPAHLAAARLAGFACHYFDLCADEDQMLSGLAREMAEHRGAVLLLNFPNNPTGQAVTKKFYAALLPLAKRYEIFVVNDFVYGEMGFGSLEPPSLLSVEGAIQVAAEIYSLSKAYSVPGWRVGALLGNAGLVGQVSRLKSIVDYGTFLPVQLAAGAALTSSQDLVGPIVSIYHSRCQVMCAGLKRLGWETPPPMAGASLWTKLPEAIAGRRTDNESTSVEFAKQLLFKTGIVVMPGCLFGSQFDGYVRLAMVLGCEDLRDMLERWQVFGRGASPAEGQPSLAGGFSC